MMRGGAALPQAARNSALPPGMNAYSPGYSPSSYEEEDGMEHRELEVSSKGNISATYRVPGVITIPSDNASHNFTVVQLRLDASMSWVVVPKVDTKTHLKVGLFRLLVFCLMGPECLRFHSRLKSRTRRTIRFSKE